MKKSFELSLSFELIGGAEELDEFFKQFVKEFRIYYFTRETIDVFDRRTLVKRPQKGSQDYKWELSYNDQVLMNEWNDDQGTYVDDGSVEDVHHHKYIRNAKKCYQKWKQAVQAINKIGNNTSNDSIRCALIQKKQKEHNYYLSVVQCDVKSEILRSHNTIYSLKDGENSKVFNLQLTFKAQVEKLDRSVKKINNPELNHLDINILKIMIRVEDPDGFLLGELKLNEKEAQGSIFMAKRKLYYEIEDTSYRNGMIIPYREGRYNREMQFFSTHYSLAFQGGGAKGLAYVGSYRAIQQTRQNNQPIPLKSIIGSSAGGIIALAISTGISYKEVQTICEQMNDIPKTDSIKPPLSKQTEKKEIDAVLEVIGKALETYGIMKKQITAGFIQSLRRIKQQIQQQFITIIEEKSPSIAKILTTYEDVQKRKKTLNLYGILVKGALMEGNAIYNIGAECLIKYFRKEQTQLKEEVFSKKLYDAFVERDNGKKQKRFGDEIKRFLRNQRTLYKNLLGVTLADIVQEFHEFTPLIICTIINKVMILLKDGKGLQQVDLSQFNHVLVLKDEGEINKMLKQETKKSKVTHKDDKANLIYGFEEQYELGKEKLKIEKFSDYLRMIKKTTRLDHLTRDYFNPNQTQNGTIDTLFEQYEQYLYHRFFLPAPTLKQYKKTLCQFLQTLFKKNQIKIQQSDLLEKIGNIFKDIVSQIPEIKKDKEMGKIRKLVQQTQTNNLEFIKLMQQINMKEYYRLTGIEMTCTSVDLDDRILRFFNHKTTPLLPVCRAVQMTGSFPVAFKAQKWRKQWGKYHIYFSREKLEIDLTGHEFTDGGLLANFPIKYLDNNDIRNKYFSYSSVKGKTIMLGFGLDYYTEGWEPNVKEMVQTQMKQCSMTSKKSIFEQLMALLATNMVSRFFEICKIVFLQIKQDKKDDQQSIEWSALSHGLLYKIPVVGFGLKILTAYPNADRNLNLQVFNQRIIVHNLQPYEHSYGLNEQERMRIAALGNSLSKYSKQIDGLKKKREEKKQKQLFAQKKAVDISWLEELDLNIKQNQSATVKSVKRQLNKSLQLFRNHTKNLNVREEKKLKEIEKLVFINNNTDEQNKFEITSLYHENNQEIIYEEYKCEKLVKILLMILKYRREDPHAKYPTVKQSLNKIYTSAKFSDIKENSSIFDAIDISESMKRMVQFLCYYETDANDKINVRTSNYQSLFTNNIQHLNFAKIKEKFRSIIKRIEKEDEHVEQGSLIRTLLDYLNNSLEETYLKMHERNCSRYPEEYYNILSQNQEELNKALLDMIGRISIEDLKSLLAKESLSKHMILDKTIFEDIRCLAFLANVDDEVKQLPMSEQEREIFLKREVTRIPHAQRKKLAQLLIDILFGKNKQRIFQKMIKSATRQRQADHQNLANQTDERHQNTNVTGFLSRLFSLIIQKREQPQRNNPNRKICHDAIETYLLQYLQLKTQFSSLSEKIRNEDPKNKELRYLNLMHRRYMGEYEYITFFIKELVFMLSNLKRSLSQQFDVRLREVKQLVKLEYFQVNGEDVEKADLEGLRTIKDALGISQIEQLMDLKRLVLKIEQYLRKSVKLIFDVERDTKRNYYKLLDMPSNAIKIRHIRQAYIVKYHNLQILANLYFDIKQLSIEYARNINRESDISKNSYINLRFIVEMFESLNYRHISLPLFEHDWKLLLKSKPIKYMKNNQKMEYHCKLERKVNFIIDHQKSIKYKNEYMKYVKEKLEELKSNFSHEKDQIIAGELNKILNDFQRSQPEPFKCVVDFNQVTPQFLKAKSQIQLLQKAKFLLENNPYEENNIDVHLIFESVGDSHEFFTTYASIVSGFLNKQKKVGRTIKALTCSNFHAVFGFLLAMADDPEVIRKEMLNIKDLALSYDMERQAIKQEFSDFKWFGQSAINQSKSVLDHLKFEHEQYFKQISSYNLKKGESIFVKNQEAARKLQAKVKYNMQFYEDVLDRVSKSIKVIDGNLLSTNKVKDICKEVALQYESKRYDQTNQQIFEDKENMLKNIYASFGSLIEAVVCSFISEYSNVTINQHNSEEIARGIIMNRLFSVFNIKAYVIEKLKAMKLSPSITLEKFFDTSPRKIFLNFSTVNVDKKRLEFINKDTKPHMPVWAAVVASASLPLLYQFFDAPRDWQDIADKESFYSFIIDDFFTEKNEQNRKRTSYCSANYLSSLPLELLTNKTISSYMPEINNMKEFAIAFNDTTTNLGNIFIKKQYINLKETIDMITTFLKGKLVQTFTLADQNKLEKTYGGNIMKDFFSNANIPIVYKILTESNDNLILQWYSDKLIRLPIRIGTLEFHEITNQRTTDKYHINVLTEKSKETVERSYEITKFFIGYLGKTRTEMDENRRKAQFKVEVVNKIESETGILDRCLKITFLNYSKWNQNKYNNFLVEYKIIEKSRPNITYTKVFSSEIVFDIEQSAQLQLKFYFPDYCAKDCTKNRVLYTSWKMNFSNLIDEFFNPTKRQSAENRGKSFYYSFDFGSYDIKSRDVGEILVLYEQKRRNQNEMNRLLHQIQQIHDKMDKQKKNGEDLQESTNFMKEIQTRMKQQQAIAKLLKIQEDAHRKVLIGGSIEKLSIENVLSRAVFELKPLRREGPKILYSNSKHSKPENFYIQEVTDEKLRR